MWVFFLGVYVIFTHIIYIASDDWAVFLSDTLSLPLARTSYKQVCILPVMKQVSINIVFKYMNKFS